MAQTSRKTEKELTIFTVSGQLTAEEVIAILEEFYCSGCTPHILWDLSKADLSQIKDQQIEKILVVAKKYAHMRQGGKTAIVTSRPVDFGVARMYESLSNLEEHTFAQSVFKELDQALHWLIG